jgi:hypothetical protein
MKDPTGDEPIIYMSDGSKAPLPEGYTLERALAILREAGLTPASVKHPDGTVTELVEEAA